MMRRYNRLLVLFFVVTDALISGSSFALAYLLRFYWLAGIFPVTKGYPQFPYYGKLGYRVTHSEISANPAFKHPIRVVHMAKDL